MRTRTVAMHVVYGLLSVWALLQAQGVVQLAVGSFPDRLHFGLASSTVFKLLSLGGALILACTGGRSTAAAQWLLVGQVAWIVAGLAAPEQSELAALATGGIGVLIWFGPWLLLSARRREILRRVGRPDGVTVTLLVLSAIVALAWSAGVGHPGLLRLPGLEQEARFDLAGLAAAVVLVGLWAAVVAPARRWAAVVVGAAVAVVGMFAVIRPHDVASPGIVSGLVAAALGLVVVARAGRLSARLRSAEREVTPA